MSRLVSANLLLYKPGVFLEPCLESLLAQDYGNFEVLIIDNHSDDGTAGKVKEFFAKKETPVRWRLIESGKNLGFAAGTNLGIKESAGELVLLLNQDIVMAPDFISKLAAAFEKDSKIGAAQGKMLRMKAEGGNLEKTQLIDSTGLEIFKNRRIVARGQGEFDKGQFDAPGEIFAADGPAPMISRQALEDAKICLDRCEYFDEDFVAYKEDADIGWRLRLLGWKAWYEPGAAAWHARTAGDKAVQNYLSIALARFKVSSRYAKYHSFKNQRFLQIKNERLKILFRHCIYFVPKEIGSWLYATVFERYTWKSFAEIKKLMPRMQEKRKLIMERRRASDEQLIKWFK